MNNIADKINKEIKEKKIEPKPKWQFTFRQVLIWILAVISMLILGLAMSLNWEVISQQQFSLLMRRPQPIFLIAKAIPYFWLVISILLSILVYFEFQKTKKGYKVKLLYIVIGILGSTLLLSFIFFFTRTSSYIQYQVECSLKPFHKILPMPKEHWLRPEHGLLSGSIVELKEDELLLEDWEQEQWQVMLDEDVFITTKINLETGEVIRVIGELEEEHSFKADKIKPWRKSKGPTPSFPCLMK